MSLTKVYHCQYSCERMVKLLEETTEKYTEGGSMTALGRCGGSQLNAGYISLKLVMTLN